ncbi:MAG TPA: hypothetical protein PKA66_03815 [Gemmatimonadales bacterium]|nr:hypothetical protein [Gemmatimonadales bacterium]
MRRMSVWSRSLAGVLAVWFGLVMAAPALLHSCPRGLAGAAMAGAGEGHAHHRAQHSDQRSPEAPTNCQCLGSCAVSTPAVLSGGTTVPFALTAPLSAEGLPATADVAAIPRIDHSQPFATAPPLPVG